MTANDLIYSAHRIAGVLAGAGRSFDPGSSEASDGLSMLNSMLDGWRAERLTVYAIVRTLFDIIPAKASYTISDTGGADLNLTRPEKIENAGLVLTNVNPNVELPFQILRSYQEWAALSLKSMPSTLGYLLYYEPEVPNGIIYLWPVPVTPNKLALYTWQVLKGFATTDDPVTIPPAYQEAIEYELAIRVATRYPERQKMSPLAIELAARAMAKIKAINTPQLMMRTEAAARGFEGAKNTLGGRWSILTNSYI